MEKIKICADPFPPYQYVDENGKVQGTDYERVTGILRAAGYEPETCIAPWSRIYGEFEAGIQDALFQAQDSPERLERFFLSHLLRYAVTEVVTADRTLTALTAYEQLQEYRVGVIADFANGPEIDVLPDSCKRAYADAAQVLDAVLRREVEFGVCDRGVKEYLMQEEPRKGKESYVVSGLTYQRPLYVMFKKEKHRDDFDEAMDSR